jgi:hypothetical protein
VTVANYRESPRKQQLSTQRKKVNLVRIAIVFRSLRHSRSGSFAFYAFFGRGLQAKMEGKNEGKYLKIGEVRI